MKLILTFFLLFNFCQAQEHIYNGSFEQGPDSNSIGWQFYLTNSCGLQNGTAGPTGWTVTNSSPDRIVNEPPCNWDIKVAYDGSAYTVYGNSESGISTLLYPLEVGVPYKFSYRICRETFRGNAGPAALIRFSFKSPFSTYVESPTITNGTPWQYHEAYFTPTAASTIIEIESRNWGSGAGVDNVSLVRLNPLPIQLVVFSGKQKGSSIRLFWTTASEVNNDHFEVEKSMEISGFDLVEKVRGAGNSTYTIDYFCEDKFPYEGVSYYRLKQVDYEGKITYSKIIPVEFSSEREDALFEYYNFLGQIIK
jgi:hypothetical protein